MAMDERSLRVLEFYKIIDKLKDQAACALGRDAAVRARPSTDIDTVRKWLQETSEAKAILQLESRMPLDGVHDVRELVEKARLESMLQPIDLLHIAETLAAGRRLRSFLLKLSDHYPLLASIARRITVFEKIEDEVNRSISNGGEVLDSASASLASARTKMKSTHSRLMDRLHSILQSSQYRTAIQDPVITLREDRYCIPVKSEYRSQLPGIIHDSSSSGATIFMEPAVVVELGNDLKRLSVKEREEVEKVLAKLTALISVVGGDILATLDALAEIDYITARAKLSIVYSANEPELDDAGYLKMREARHPLLTGDVVPVDVELGRSFRALLITGPNTGGKTVTLKTIGLLTLMAQTGMHIPAAPGSTVAVFDRVFADIGDEQSIEQSLSTFSSHIGNIVKVIQDLTPNSLVLFDELGAGTDPAEGAALAKALLDFLIESGARIVATTHYGELKEFAFIRDSVENASVEFDAETLQPTYRLLIGVPGSSNALAIANRLGMPEHIVTSAQANMYGKGDTSAEIIRGIEEARRASLNERRDTHKALVDAEALRRRYEEQVRKAEETRQRAKRLIQTEAENIIRKYSKRLDRTLDQLAQQKAETKRAEKLEKEAGEAITELTERLVQIPEIVEEPAGDYAFNAGDPVRIASLHQEGVLIDEIEDGEATVQIGAMKVTVEASDLRPARSPEQKTGTGPVISAQVFRSQFVSPELKLIAHRVEPALEKLDQYLYDALAAGLQQVRVIHGVGTGALKRAVWEHLQDHPTVESYRLAERNQGGAGATIVELKK